MQDLVKHTNPLLTYIVGISSLAHIEKNDNYYDADNTVDSTDGRHRKQFQYAKDGEQLQRMKTGICMRHNVGMQLCQRTHQEIGKGTWGSASSCVQWRRLNRA